MLPPLIGSVAAAFSSGALAWVFLVQAPFLSRTWGRDRFVPLQMALMKLLLMVTGVASLLMLLSAVGHLRLLLAGGALSTSVVAAALVPRALRAGGHSLNERLDADASHSAARFLADGGGAATEWLHRALGLTIVATLGLQVAWQLAAGAHHHADAPPPAPTARFRADAATTETVGALTEQVAHALASPPQTGSALAEQLQGQYALIFSRCTMTGEAHEALHGFLLPIGDELALLAKAADPESTRRHLERLRELLAAFPRTFES